jgi:hypothetical protein
MKSTGTSFFLLALTVLARGQEEAAVPQITAPAILKRGSVNAASRCAFSMIIQGGKSSTAYQLPDGQIRIDTSSAISSGSSRFYLNGGIVRDAEGRGCIVTSPERQVQCNLNHPGESSGAGSRASEC